MESNKILGADILDIIFDGKNKEYGAYELRKTYNRRLFKSIAVTGIVIGLVFLGGIVSGRGTKRSVAPSLVDSVQLAAVEKDPLPPTAPPPLPKPQPVPIKTIAVTPPRIVPDDKADAPPPTVEEQADAKIGTVTTDGRIDDESVVAPPAPAGNGKVIEEPKKKDDEPEIWTKVEIESEFPGGMAAWLRFLHKNLDYPQEAINLEIGGQVMVQFIVDEQGNVSNVQAISGPDKGGLREEAVRVIRKSGLWTAAIQNGRKVKSYKRQPITFVAPE
ncbi:MAG: energy transducer TonB [Bacteroidetes bacterium]|nr:energy transducer TonB [Bacteroidota bacterium]